MKKLLIVISILLLIAGVNYLLKEEKIDPLYKEANFDRSQNVTLPGWMNLTISSERVSKVKNPQENIWYEVYFYYNDKLLTKEVCGINFSLKDLVKKLNKNYSSYSLEKHSKNFLVEGYDVKCEPFIKDETLTLKIDEQEYEIIAKTQREFYSLDFELYIDNELICQNKNVLPGEEQKLNMIKELPDGKYDVEMIIKPYRSDGSSCPEAIVNTTLTKEA